MLLTSTEYERLTIFAAADLGRKRGAKRLKLNRSHAVMPIKDDIAEDAPEGRSMAERGSPGSTIRTTPDGRVTAMIPVPRVEGASLDGTKPISVHEPIPPVTGAAGAVEPGASVATDSDVELNAQPKRATVSVRVDPQMFNVFVKGIRATRRLAGFLPGARRYVLP
jgi:urease gamma subunit